MILEAESTLRGTKTDTVYAKLASTRLVIWQGGHGGPRGPTKSSFSPPKRNLDAIHVFQTSPEQALLYRHCGDYNPMHADDEFGRNGGFEEDIIHGLGLGILLHTEF